MKLEEIKKEVEKVLEEKNHEDSAFKSGVILLSALVVGAKPKVVANFTGYDYEFVKKRARRLRKNGIWKDGKTFCEWDDEKTGGIAFCCDVLCAEGLVKRS